MPGGDETLQVVRRIERGLGSAYRVNGRDVRARDVALLFADAATGAHSPALVSQGRIGAIIAAKPAERRALLEEAAGISAASTSAVTKPSCGCGATEANLTRLDDVIAAQTAAVAALRRAAKAAERYRAVSHALAGRREGAGGRALDRGAGGCRGGGAGRRSGPTRQYATRPARQRGWRQHRPTPQWTLPALRTAEAEAAAGLQAIIQAQRALVAEADRIALRSRDLAALGATVDRDRCARERAGRRRGGGGRAARGGGGDAG